MAPTRAPERTAAGAARSVGRVARGEPLRRARDPPPARFRGATGWLSSEPLTPVDLRDRSAASDRLLEDAALSLVQQEPEPYESVADRLWHKGRSLFSSCLAALEPEGQVSRRPRRWGLVLTGRICRSTRRLRAAVKRFPRCRSCRFCSDRRHSRRAEV